MGGTGAADRIVNLTCSEPIREPTASGQQTHHRHHYSTRAQTTKMMNSSVFTRFALDNGSLPMRLVTCCVLLLFVTLMGTSEVDEPALRAPPRLDQADFESQTGLDASTQDTSDMIMYDTSSEIYSDTIECPSQREKLEGAVLQNPHFGGLKLSLPPSLANDGIWPYGAWPKYFWDEPENKPPKSWMIDVGANVGLTAMGGAWLGHTVVAFEPAPVNLPYLRDTLCANHFSGKVIVVPSALGAESGSTTFYQQPKYGDNSAISESAALRVGSQNIQKITVPIQTLDEWLAGHPDLDVSACVLLKIDVQGYELRVLEGATKFLQDAGKSLVIRAEHDDELIRKGLGTDDVDGVKRLLTGYGFASLGRDGDDILWRKP